jgi:hypothetical protein
VTGIAELFAFGTGPCRSKLCESAEANSYVLHAPSKAISVTWKFHHASPGDETLSIKGGSLDDPVDLSTAFHIWTKQKLPVVVIPDGARQFAGEPD